MKGFLSSLFFFILVIGLIGFGVMHEQVHVAIYRSYGIESHVEYLSHFPNFTTMVEKECPTDMCKFANNLNEIIGYPLMVIYVVIGIFLEISIILKEENLMLKEKGIYGR